MNGVLLREKGNHSLFIPKGRGNGGFCGDHMVFRGERRGDQFAIAIITIAIDAGRTHSMLLSGCKRNELRNRLRPALAGEHV